MRKLSPILLLALAACVSAPDRPTTARPSVPIGTPPPQDAAKTPEAGAFRAPRILDLPGLEHVIGKNETALANLFGPPRLNVKEGDARKLQFVGEACVLDIYLYPLQPRGEPSATYVDARRASDGVDVDRAACARALRR